MFDHIRAADSAVLLLNTLLLMVVAFLPFATSVLADALRDGDDQRTAVVFYALAFDVTALTFNGVWQYARRHRLLGEALAPAGATAIGRRFQLALIWLTSAALLGALLPVVGVALIAAFNAVYWLPIAGESAGTASSAATDAPDRNPTMNPASSRTTRGSTRRGS